MFLLYNIMLRSPPPTSQPPDLPEDIRSGSSGKNVDSHFVKSSPFAEAEPEAQRVAKDVQSELVPRLPAPRLGFSHCPQQHSWPKFWVVPEEHTFLAPAYTGAAVALT